MDNDDVTVAFLSISARGNFSHWALKLLVGLKQSKRKPESNFPYLIIKHFLALSCMLLLTSDEHIGG